MPVFSRRRSINAKIKGRRVNPGVARAIHVAGGQVELGRRLGISQVAVHKLLYVNCPAERAKQIEDVTGVHRREIRPDLFVEE